MCCMLLLKCVLGLKNKHDHDLREYLGVFQFLKSSKERLKEKKLLKNWACSYSNI